MKNLLRKLLKRSHKCRANWDDRSVKVTCIECGAIWSYHPAFASWMDSFPAEWIKDVAGNRTPKDHYFFEDLLGLQQ